jgi:hypothetical protein
LFTRVKTSGGGRTVVYVDDVATSCFEGDTVAAVVMLDGKQPYRRTMISGLERAPFCMMGVCFECLVEIDGIANQQGCLRKIEPGMRIRRQLPAGLKLQNRDDKP